MDRKKKLEPVSVQDRAIRELEALECKHYAAAQDVALAWFSKCQDGPNDFAGTKRQVDDHMLSKLTFRRAIIVVAGLEA